MYILFILITGGDKRRSYFCFLFVTRLKSETLLCLQIMDYNIFYQNNMQMNFPLHSHILFESPWPFDMQIQMDKSFIAIIIILMCSAHFAHVSISFEWDFNMRSILPHCIRWREKNGGKRGIYLKLLWVLLEWYLRRSD